MELNSLEWAYIEYGIAYSKPNDLFQLVRMTLVQLKRLRIKSS